MKKFLVNIILFFGLISSCAFAQESVYLAIQEVEPTFSQKVEFDDSDEVKDETVEESTLQGVLTDENIVLNEAENKISPLEAEIEYDVLYDRTPIFSEYTKFEFEKGPIETLNPYFVYQGQMNFNFLHSGYGTEYQSPVAEMIVQGKFRNKELYYNFNFDMLSYDGYNFFQTVFKDYGLTLKSIPNNSITIGRFRTPIGFEGGMSSYTLPFIARSQISRNFGSIRGMGIRTIGNYKYADYNIGVTSSDRKYNDFFPGIEFNGWVNFKPLGNTDGSYGVLKVGGGLNAGRKDFSYNVIGAYISYKFRKFAIESEYAISNGSNGNTGLTRNKAQGVYTTLSYNLTKKLQVLARYDLFDADRTCSGKKSSEYTAGINYFIKGSALKIMLNFTHRKSDYEKSSNRIMLGTQFIL